MTARLKFLQNYCLILTINLFHKPTSAPNELLWGRCITTELSKISNILYAKTTSSYNTNSVARNQPRIDLVLSSSNVDQLSDVVFNLRGIQIKEQEIDCRRISSIDSDFLCKPQDHSDLTLLNQSLVQKWMKRNHNEDCSSSEYQQFIRSSPLLFNSKPIKTINTINGRVIPMVGSHGSQSTYNVLEHQGSRFFIPDRIALSAEETRYQDKKPPKEGQKYHSMDSSAKEFHDFIERFDKVNHHLYLALSPLVYPDFNSLPDNLQKWMYDMDVYDFSLNQEAGEVDELDLLLHGFKGFK